MLIPFEELLERYGIAPKGVLHLGANTGQEAEDYYHNGVLKVIWVEALPAICQKLRNHISKYRSHVGLLGCLSDEDDVPVKFNVASNGAQSSSFLEFGTHSKEHPTVKFVESFELLTIRLDTLLRTYGEGGIGPDWFLNVDLQGAELKALKGMGEYIDAFRSAYIEVNERELYKGCPLVGAIDVFMQQKGFTPMEVKMTGSGWGDKFYLRK